MISLSVRSTTLFLFLITIVALGEARITASKTKKPFQLLLTPVQSAAFAFYIIFGLTTLFQSLSAFFKAFSALRNLGRPAQVDAGGRDVTTGSLSVILVFLGACSALVYDVLSTVWIVYVQNQFVQRMIPDAFFSGKFAVQEGTDFLICSAMLALLYHRTRLVYGDKAEELRPYKFKLIFDALLLLSLLSSIIVYAALRSAYSSVATVNILDAYNQLLTTNRAVIGLYCALAINVTASSIWTWLKLKRISQPDAVSFLPIFGCTHID